MELISVSKDGEYLEVHPSTLAQHKALGWKECTKQEAEKQPTSDESIAVEPKKRGRPAKE
jgi:hypothetical protein